ncbi:response regulator [Novosphingobium sp.]|uniref:response regulator n=1 Tax=Novosphingobium sp. TaxID=1874826 RepID=UPI002FDA3EED
MLMADATVLLVEDHETLGAYITLALVDQGCKVLGPATSVSDALSILGEGKPDAAVLDYQLSDGETSEAVLAILEERNVPVCVISGSLREQLPPDFFKYPFLQKPFGPQDLYEVLERL